MNLEEEKKIIQELIKEHDQEHLLQFWDELTQDEQEELLKNIRSIDFKKIKSIFRSDDSSGVDLKEVTPPNIKRKHNTPKDIIDIGEKAIKEGKLAIFLLAGGQGSRLGFDGPKGCFPVSPLKKKTLYQLFAEKVLAASIKYDVKLEFYIMTSIATHKDTIRYFEENDFFGLDEDQVVFFEQDLLPALSKEGKVLLKDKGKVNLVPTGTGTVFTCLYNSRIINRMEEKGIEYFQYLQIDDAIAAVADPAFLGFHIKEHSSYSSKVVEKKNPAEPVGVFVEEKGRLKIAEYIHLPTELAIKRDDSGRLTFRAVNIANHIINKNFAKRVATEVDLPFYKAHKKIAHINEEGKLVKPTEPNAYKLESFSFDAMPYAEKTVLLEVRRDDEFAPVKYGEGEMKTPKIAAEQMSTQGKRWLEAAGIDNEIVAELETVEISPLFALDEKEFVEKIKDRKGWLEKQLKGRKKVYLE